MNLYKKLVKHKVIEDGFNHDGLDEDISKKYIYFEKIFNDEYEGYASAFKLSDCLFYINNYRYCNAFARRLKGYNVIGITCSYVMCMENFFDRNVYEQIYFLSSKDGANISKAYSELLEMPNFSFNQYILNCSIHFTFGHEFRHILQFNTQNRNEKYYLNENINSSTFKLQNHVWEYDADRYGAWHVLKYIFNICNELKIKNDEQIKCLIYTGMSNIIITQLLFYFGLADVSGIQKIQKIDFYTKKKSHPHPMVRILYILDFYFDNLEGTYSKLNITKQDLLNNSLLISKIYLDTILPEKDLVAIFLNDLTNLDEINRYSEFLYESAIKDETIKYMWDTAGAHFWGDKSTVPNTVQNAKAS